MSTSVYSYGYNYFPFSTTLPPECEETGKCNPNLGYYPYYGTDQCTEAGTECIQTTHGTYDSVCSGECLDPSEPISACEDTCSTDADCDTANYEVCKINYPYYREGTSLFGMCQECVDACLFVRWNCITVDDCSIAETELQSYNYNDIFEMECVKTDADARCGYCQESYITDTTSSPHTCADDTCSYDECADGSYCDVANPQTAPLDDLCPYNCVICSNPCDSSDASACSVEGEICTVGKDLYLTNSGCASCQSHCVEYLGGCETDDDCVIDTEYMGFSEAMTCYRHSNSTDCGWCGETCATGTCNPYIDSTDQCDGDLVCLEQIPYSSNPYYQYISECDWGVCSTAPESCTDACDQADSSTCADTESCVYNTGTGGFYYGMQYCLECVDTCVYQYGCRDDADCEQTNYYSTYPAAASSNYQWVCYGYDADADECGYCTYNTDDYYWSYWNSTDEPAVTDDNGDVVVVTDGPQVTDDSDTTNAPQETEETADATECATDSDLGFCWGRSSCQSARTLASDVLQFCKVCAQMDSGSCVCEEVIEDLLSVADGQGLDALNLAPGIQNKILDNCWEDDVCSGIDDISIVNTDACGCSVLMCGNTLGGDFEGDDDGDDYRQSGAYQYGVWLSTLITVLSYVIS